MPIASLMFVNLSATSENGLRKTVNFEVFYKGVKMNCKFV